MTKTKISWLPWSKESFDKAHTQDKPILLGISAVWCHWCHVMDQTTYSDSVVARLIEENFVPIRVDRDQRPDIDKRYNMGGWPTTAFLTPDGEVLTGGTYFPPQQMLVLLDHISSVYKKEKADLKQQIRELKQQKPQIPQAECELDGEVYQSVVDALMLHVASRFDSVYGGFGDAPKFPFTEALRLTLLHNRLAGHQAALNIVKKTLSSMQSGGVYDHEDGGFFRYSTTKDWSVPHYEKMCEDNAKLLMTFLEAYQVTGDNRFKETAKGILGYVSTKLSDQKKGGFYGSQDADEEYYKLSLKERANKTAPRIDQTLYVNWNALMVSGFLLAGTVLDEPSYHGFAYKTVDYILDKAYNPTQGMSHYVQEGKGFLSGLLADQVYMVKCLTDCYQVSMEKKFLDKALTIAQFMLDRLWDADEGGFFDKPVDGDALGALKLLDKPLEENSAAVEAMLRLHHFTGEQHFLDTAKRVLDFFAVNVQRYGVMGAVYGLAVEMYLRPLVVHVVGSKKDETTKQFVVKCLKTYYPLKVVQVLDPNQDKVRLAALGYPAGDVPLAYVCFGGTCNTVNDPNKVADYIKGASDANN
ncbi:MAG: DUF255 domain-containing protein [Candidatus Bathyarchaeia archaeon]|jgi:hypothetical protein